MEVAHSKVAQLPCLVAVACGGERQNGNENENENGDDGDAHEDQEEAYTCGVQGEEEVSDSHTAYEGQTKQRFHY